MNLSHSELIEFCIQLLQSYNPSLESVDFHLNLFLKDVPALDERDETFVEEVFSGCVRFNSVLRVVVDGFYQSDGKFVLRQDECLYMIITYLILFRADELGNAHLKKFLVSQDVNKMHKFLNFVIDENNYNTWMKDAWYKDYDSAFVDKTILGPLVRNMSKRKGLLDSLQRVMDNIRTPHKKTIPPVELKPFNLAKSKPIKIPVPERIPVLSCYRPVPATTYAPSKNDAEFQKAKMQNWEKAQKLHEESIKQSPSCAGRTEKSDKAKLRMQEYVEKENQKLNFNQRYCNPPPTAILTDIVPIKLTTTAILREGKLYQKREEDELKKLEKLESGYGDARAFNEWQTKMRQFDHEKQLVEFERRHLDGMLSKEDAILARQKLTQEKRDGVAQMRAQAEKYMEFFLKDRLEEQEHTRELVEKVTIAHENAREAKNKLHQYKSRIVQNMIEESKELMRQALEEAEVVMKQKMELINQIKEMESGRTIRQKLVDLSESSGIGLLCEMSVMELRERLHILRMEWTEQEENKRKEIFTNKQLKDQMLMDTIETISRHRLELSKATANRNEEKRKTIERKIPKDEKLDKMRTMIDEKKTQRLREKELAKKVESFDQLQQPRPTAKSKKLLEDENWTEDRGTASTQLRSSGLPKMSSATNSRLALLAV